MNEERTGRCLRQVEHIRGHSFTNTHNQSVSDTLDAIEMAAKKNYDEYVHIASVMITKIITPLRQTYTELRSLDNIDSILIIRCYFNFFFVLSRLHLKTSLVNQMAHTALTVSGKLATCCSQVLRTVVTSC